MEWVPTLHLGVLILVLQENSPGPDVPCLLLLQLPVKVKAHKQKADSPAAPVCAKFLNSVIFTKDLS